jgi:cold shock CspA family protein
VPRTVVKKDFGYVDEDFAVDPETRYAGTVAFYSKLRGYGFVTMEVKDFAPNDSVFIHWRDLKSDDRFPSLYKGLTIEFGIQKWKERGKYTLRCKDVSMPGGEALALQDTVLAEKKEFIGGQDCRYAGLLKFYNPRTGIGYVTLDTPVEEVPAELRVERSEVNSGNTSPGWMSDVKVEFGVWKTARGFHKAYNMTLPGGAPITMAVVENRVATATGQTFTGEVTMWNWQKGWGFIKPAEASPLPEDVQAKLAEQAKAAVEKATTKGKESSSEPLLYFSKTDVAQGQRLTKGVQVMFQLYMDDKGAGASGITVV